ncbi:MAG: zinc ribbon domain-containing protein [Planctomycetaceae bacterium]|nr:zinc ribbon domain-containing protein [Planctomycetaceae bacterium]
MSQSMTPSGETDKPQLPSAAAASANEHPCPECGEQVRSGMVRCFNCGAFLRKEIADKYAQMQSKPPQITLSEVPAGEAVSLDDDGGFELKIIEARAAGEAAESEAGDAAAPAGEVAEADSPASSPKREAQEDTGVSHSVATGGDVLLQVALSEQAEERRRRKERGVSLRGGARTPGGFVIYCPYGCRIEVKDQHRGMTGTCPKCRAPFVVPVDPPDYGYRERAAEEAAAVESASPTGRWAPWYTDQKLHLVVPEKLKLKAGSLQKDFVPVDLGISPDGLLLVNLAAKKTGGFWTAGAGTDKKKPEEIRAAVHQHLKEEKPAAEVPAQEFRIYTADEAAQLAVAQPAPNPMQSMFAGVAVFGEKQIAVQLPLTEGQPPQFLSFALLQFRQFAEAVRSALNVDLSPQGVPMEDAYDEYRCHYLDVPIKALKELEWYQSDPAFGVTLAGWKCAACGLTISEEARKKENFGGKGGKAIAKAKCPKCSNKFGEQPLYTLPSQLTAPTLGEGETAAS